MNDAAQIAVLLLELYAAFGVMLIGFGYMVAGKTGGGRVAQFYFGGSLRWTLGRLRALVVGVLTGVWGLCLLALAGIGRAIVRIARHARPRLQPRERKASSERGPFWQVVRRLLGDIDQWRRRYVGMQSITFLLFLFCVAVAIFLISLVLLLRS